MLIYDTMARKEINLDLRDNRVVKLFVCGPTVQDSFHLGHARTYIFFDTFAKYLRTKGLSVFYLQNITDIDDKIINRAKEDEVPYEHISEKYTAEYFELMKTLRVDSVNFYAKATDHIDEIIRQISDLVRNGFAYETSDGVYFSVSKFSDFGHLSGQDMDALKAGARVEFSEEKQDPRDFVIWKKMKPGEPFWESPWGKGRPGWHVEDTAITESYFGPSYDIHGSGTDLIFPHHEAEIAIERSISGMDHLSRYWVHSAMININEEKMSKSLKNYVTIRAVLNDFSPEDLRFALLNVQFRSNVNFSEEVMREARSNVETINTLYRKLKIAYGKSESDSTDKLKIPVDLVDSLEKGFDLRSFFRDLLTYVGDWNSRMETMGGGDILNAMKILEWADSFTGILRPASGTGNVDELVELALKIRRNLREKKDYASSDLIRSGLRDIGIYIEDRGDETIWWQS